LADTGRTCGVEDAAPAGPQGLPDAGGAGALALGSVQIAQVAIDADHEYYLSKGSSTTNVTNQIESIFNTLNQQYESEVQIVHTLTTVIVRTDPNDPYTTTSAGSLLDQLKNHWNAQQGSVVRDVVHMFTGVNLSGSTIGIAYLSVVCKKSSAYGLVQSDCCGSFASKTDLSAHELGHNWSAGHCDCVGWTMNPWITSANQFHPTASVPQIQNYANAQSCLDAGPGSSVCDVTQYGVGLGGANVGTLASASTPSIGSTFAFSFDGFGGFAAGALVVAAQTASLPFAGGTLLVALPSQLAALPVQSFFGAGGAVVAIPDDPGLVGLSVHAQVGLLAPALPGGLAFSNGLSLLLCD
ncbi:MAG TPA: zinc-dependent metalloprotease family protein, partial [Planctomycetota bacterium]|nr:zinc-dependent metalloprotease family protein [Planctomycetota bacterium]